MDGGGEDSTAYILLYRYAKLDTEKRLTCAGRSIFDLYVVTNVSACSIAATSETAESTRYCLPNLNAKEQKQLGETGDRIRLNFAVVPKFVLNMKRWTNLALPRLLRAAQDRLHAVFGPPLKIACR
jgi:hypothetical protein